MRTFFYDEDLMQRSDDSLIYHRSGHEPERAVNLKKLPEWPKAQYQRASILTAHFQCLADILTCNYVDRSWSYNLGPETVHITQAKFFAQRKALLPRGDFPSDTEWQWIRNTSWAVSQFHSDSGFFLEASVPGIPRWGGMQWAQTCSQRGLTN